MQCLTHLFRIFGLLCLLVLGFLFFQFNVFAMQFASSWQPGSGHIVFLVLTGIELAGFVMLFLAWYPKRSKLILHSNPTKKQLDAFAAEMRTRLHTNKLVREQGLKDSDPEYISKALEILDKKAEEIIRQDSRKIFLGTALAQNGRLDAIIVFVALTRMIWRISKIYNQRPTPAEIWSVYTTVSSTAFIAFSIDALDIPSTVTEAMNSLVPAVGPHMATTTLPFMGNAMHLFSNAILDGAANGLLAIRAGIITKNAFRFSSLDEAGNKALTTREITQAMLALSKECIADIMVGLKDQFKDMGKSVTGSCIEKTKEAAKSVGSVVSSVGSCAEAVGGAVATAVSGAVTGAVNGVGSTVEAVGGAVGATAGAVRNVASAVGETVSSAGTKIMGSSTAPAASDADTGETAAIQEEAQKEAPSGNGRILNRAKNLLHKGTATTKSAVEGTGRFLGRFIHSKKKEE